MRRLENRVAIVTGGGSGLGQAVAHRFAQEGAKVMIAEIHAGNGETTAAAIRAAGGDAVFMRCDVSQSAEVEAMTAACVARYGGLDILYANAAIELIGEDAKAHELSEEVWDRTLAVNLKGIWLTCKYALIEMLKRGRGSIILAASPTGLLGCAPGETAYSTSKGGVAGLARVMAAEYARDRIRVNALVPGCMDTPMNEKYFTSEESKREFAESVPLGRLGLAEDVCGLVAFLASDEAAYCTGGFYMADGGLTAI